MLDKLADATIDVNTAADFQEVPLHVAVKRKNSAALEWLLQNGGKPDMQNALGETPFHYAVRTNDKLMVELLLYHKADASTRSKQDETPLSIAQASYPELASYITSTTHLAFL